MPVGHVEVEPMTSHPFVQSAVNSCVCCVIIIVGNRGVNGVAWQLDKS